MKKTTSLLIGMLCLSILANAQQGILIDNSVQGTGLKQHNYVGAGWVHGTNQSSFYNNTLSYSNVTGAYVTISFVGSGIEWYTEKRNTHGITAVSIDGGAETFIDLYSSAEQHVLVYSSPVLPQGTHTFKIRTTGTKNVSSTGFYAVHDYCKIFSSGPTSDFTNTVTGHVAFASNTLGTANTAIGYEALHFNTTGNLNTAIGATALYRNTSGGLNEAVGYAALGANTSGNSNQAFGSDALYSNTTGSMNVAVGHFALGSNISGHYNVALGYQALYSNNTGQGNTSVGNQALLFNKGSWNTAIGYGAGPLEASSSVEYSTAIGFQAITTASNQVRIGNPNITSIGGQVSWSTLSDGRFKTELREDVSGLEFVNKLRPVSYMVDKTSVQKFLGVPDSVIQSAATSKEKPTRQTGFVAQEVDALVKKSGYVFSGVDVPKNDQDPYTIRYAEFVVPLVKAVQELSAKNEEQQKQIDELLEKLGDKEEENSGLKSTDISLLQNNPNPFSVNTEIKMVLPETVGSATIIVYNLEGKQLKTLEVKGRGNTSASLVGNELSAGMYIYALIADGKVVDTKRMILTK